MSETKTHPSYGCCMLNKASVHPPRHQFKSRIAHSHLITLRVNTASLENSSSTSVNSEFMMPGKCLVEISMSLEQWGALISNCNGMASPCTISYVKGERISPCPAPEDPLAAERRMATEEMERRAQHMKENQARFHELLNKKSLTKADRVELAKLYEGSGRYFSENFKFQVEQFTALAESIVTEGKVEMTAHVEQLVQRLPRELATSFKQQALGALPE